MAAILLAEDDNAVREFVTRALEHDGHDVTAVEDGSLALEALAGQSFDMLLSDIVMPELDGIALALKVSKDYPGLPRVPAANSITVNDRGEIEGLF